MTPVARVRRAAAAGAALTAAQAASTLLFGTSPAGVAASNLLLLAAALATALAATAAVRRADGFARRFWLLVAASLWIWAAAQAHYSYQEIWLGVSATQPSLAHLLYRLYGAPLVMALLLRDEELPAIDWQRAFDFAQVGILFLFFYFDLYFVPGTGWRGLVDLNLLGFIDLSDIENWLLAAAFALRARFASSRGPRQLAARWAPFLAAYAVTSTFYNYATTYWSSGTGDWDEWPWVATFAVGLLLVCSWGPEPASAARAAAQRPPSAIAAGAFGSDWLPALIPLVTLALALRTAPHDAPAAYAAVFGSALCFGARLVVTQTRQERALAALRASERRHSQLVLDLEAKNAELERFTYTVSHDLRSPLITILGFLGFVERALAAGEPGKAAADLERIRAAATRMERLLRELLEVSRIGRVHAPAQAVRLEALACEAVASAQGAIAAAGVEVRVEPGLPAVHGDPVRLRQALQNLVDNAVKFTAGRPDACVTIGPGGVDAAGRRLLFVRDNGIGIDPRHHERVFGLFERLDNAREGTGVGLAIVKRVVELHGGRVWVDSTPGQGATFWLALPGAAEAPATS